MTFDLEHATSIDFIRNNEEETILDSITNGWPVLNSTPPHNKLFLLHICDGFAAMYL